MTVDARTLAEQGTKYVTALASILRKQGREAEIPRIEVIFVLGNPPGIQGMGLSRSPDDYYRSVFAPINGHHQLYDQLIENARKQYQDYLDASREAKQLDELLADLSALPVTQEPEGSTGS